MNQPTSDTLSVVVERDMPHPPEKIWRALTESNLIAEWLMSNDFAPVLDRNFKFTADWGGVDGRVLAIEANKSISYTWDAMGLESVVTWTLTPTDSGTHVRMVHSGFRHDTMQAYHGAQYGWQKFIGALEDVVARTE